MPEVTAQKVYMIHCEDCGMLFINNDTANPDEAENGDDYPTTTDTLADAKKSIAAHKRYHAKEETPCSVT